MNVGSRILIASLAVVSGIAGQPSLTFEVASIRPHPPNNVFRSRLPASSSLVRLEGYTIFGLVMDAYDLKDYQLAFGTVARPEDIYDTMYDITARAPGEGVPRPEQVRAMLQALLADRFALKVHRDTKEMPVYAVVTAKNGPRLRASSSDAPCSAHEKLASDGRNNEMAYTGCTIDALTGNLGNMVDGRAILDQTGLTGTFDFRLLATPESRSRNQANPADISVFAAVGELGLKLVPQKAQIEILVVDHVEKPTGN